MRTLGEPPIQRRVVLKSGRVLGLIADAYGEVNGHYVFEIVVSATKDERADRQVVLTGTNSSHPDEVSIAVAVIPVEEVQEITTEDWPDGIVPPVD